MIFELSRATNDRVGEDMEVFRPVMEEQLCVRKSVVASAFGMHGRLQELLTIQL
jgi:hypothetical protein